MTGPAPLGPRFAAARGRPDGWPTARELLAEQLTDVVDAVRVAHGATAAVAGTLWLQQYASILVAPVIATLVDEGLVLPCGPTEVRVQCTTGLPTRVAFATDPRDSPRPARAAAEQLFAGHLLPAVDILHRSTRAGSRVLRGGIANAVATAFLHLSWRAPDKASLVPDAIAFLTVAGLSDLVRVTAAEVAGTRWFYADRRACCLAFRTELNRTRESPYCATCPVVPRATTRELFERAAVAYRSRELEADPGPEGRIGHP